MRILPGPLWKKLVRFGTRGFIERDRKYLEILDRISQIRFHRQKNHVGPFVPLVTLVTAVFWLVQRTMNADYLKTLLSNINIEAKITLQQFCLSVSLPLSSRVWPPWLRIHFGYKWHQYIIIINTLKLFHKSFQFEAINSKVVFHQHFSIPTSCFAVL